MRKTNDNVNHSLRNNEDGVLDLIHTVMHQYRSMQYQALRDGPHDITHMEGKVLGFFGRHPGATQSDLAKHSGRDKAQLARLIKGLRDRGLLDAVADESDKRNVRLTLTSDGQSVLTVLRQQAKRLNTLALQEMDSHEQEQLLQLLQRVKVNLDAGS
ncbi:MAG: MarR family transcriptional regulator [Undibacterium sp.]|nr:MarR family transcriptional regulator [Undibacterium sp.]MDP1978532.1 MarR family transcriptional regulator [Undibacterium sp.]